MLEENQAERDIAGGSLYLSDNLSPGGASGLSAVPQRGGAQWDRRHACRCDSNEVNSYEKPRKLKSGGFSKPPEMRSNAHTMLAGR